MFTGSNVLVCGATGFIGSNLVNRLINEGAQVKAACYTSPQNNPNKNVQWHSGNLEEQKFCEQVTEGVDYLFMCASNTSGAAVMEKTPLVHVTPNVIMTSRVLEAAYASGIKKCLFLSSSTVYPFSDYAVCEDDVNFDFYSKYYFVGWMKIFCEQLFQMYTKLKNPMSTIILRPGNAYGPGDDFDFATSHVLPALIRRVVERHNPITVWGTGEDIRDFIYIDDLIDGMLLAMNHKPIFDIFNVSSGKGIGLGEILEILVDIESFQESEIVFDKTKPTMIPKRLINIEKARKELNFRAQVGIRQGLQKTIEWYKKNVHTI